MKLSASELARRDDFAESYRLGQLPAMRAIERDVCGCDYGATSWATRDEADRIAGLLDLGPGMRLLEIGAGSGWPALYLTANSGCDVVLTDLPLNGLQIAMDRAADDGLVGESVAGTCSAAVADAGRLPFADGCFETINHSDVLCCLLGKRQVLAECRRVLSSGGRMVFTVIHVPSGLPAGDYARAVETAPEFVGSDSDYPAMLAATGWTIRRQLDLTAEFNAACIQKLRAEQDRQAELTALWGKSVFRRRSERMQRRIKVLERGQMKRELFFVEPAGLAVP